MLSWQQEQREDFHLHLLGQAVLDEEHGIILPVTATLNCSSQPHSRLPSATIWKASQWPPACEAELLFRVHPIAVLLHELAAFGLPGGSQAVVNL